MTREDPEARVRGAFFSFLGKKIFLPFLGGDEENLLVLGERG